MREDVLLWWKQSEKDFEAAKKNNEIKEYYLVAFLCQQAVEKGLKALYLEKLKSSPGPIHSLLLLARALSVPEEYMTTLRRLSVDFVSTRYPDAASGLPYELYDAPIAKERILESEKVLIWIRKQFK